MATIGYMYPRATEAISSSSCQAAFVRPRARGESHHPKESGQTGPVDWDPEQGIDMIDGDRWRLFLYISEDQTRNASNYLVVSPCAPWQLNSWTWMDMNSLDAA